MSIRWTRKRCCLFLLHRYGDKVPKSVVARIFSVIWIILGLISMSMIMAHITSTLTALSLEQELSLKDLKVCCMLHACYMHVLFVCFISERIRKILTDVFYNKLLGRVHVFFRKEGLAIVLILCQFPRKKGEQIPLGVLRPTRWACNNFELLYPRCFCNLFVQIWS